MKLPPQEKANLLDAAKKVYVAYATLDFFKSREFITQSGQTSLYGLCQKAITKKTSTQSVLLNGVHYQLDLTPEKNNSYSVHFSRLLKGRSEIQTKPLKHYSDAEVLALFTQQEFTLHSKKHQPEFLVANKIASKHVIGGPGKIDLYRTHLVTLYHIIAKLETEEDLSALLVALATGSGKTFVQALWMLVLSVSGNNGVFAIQDNLRSEFISKLKGLLPDAFVNSMLTLVENGSNSKAHLLLKNLKNPNIKGQIIIAASQYLLDNYYNDLEGAPESRTYLSFDEQHLLMKTERHRVRLIELAKQKLTLFLTATPNQETYKLAGNKPVALMSSGQKKEAGQGSFPRIAQFEALYFTSRNRLKDYRFWTLDFWNIIANNVLSTFNPSIQEEQSSPTVSVLNDLFFYHFDKEGEDDVRWRMQVPVARKMLCIIDDNKTLVNFCHALEHHDLLDRTVHKNGNLIGKTDVMNFSGLPLVMGDVVVADLEHRKAQYSALLKDDESELSIIRYNRSLKDRLKYTIFHNMVEYVLSDITGLDEIQHNYLRKNNVAALQHLVLKNFRLRTAAYYKEQLVQKIDTQGATEISVLLAAMSQCLAGMVAERTQNEQGLTQFIDNWALNSAFVDEMKQSHFELRVAFDFYADRHLMMGVMSGMAKEEWAIAESRPFSQLAQHNQSICDNNSPLAKKAKKRKHSSIEPANNTSTKAIFTPNYLNISENIADNYFRLGFIGMYVSNKKTQGFSDKNLHTVINITEHTLAANNSPECQIQAIGLNLGLDATIEPAYIHATGCKQKSTFDLNHLKCADYYPELFKAQKKYDIDFVKSLGEKLSKQIIQWVYTRIDDDETINPDCLKRQVLKFIVHALRETNNKNSHQIKLSRAQLVSIVSDAISGIKNEVAEIKNPYHVPFALSTLTYFLNFISECYYSIKRIPAAAKMYYHSWFGTRIAASPIEGGRHADDVYIKIIQKTSFKELTSQTVSFLELERWIGQKVKGLKTKESKSGSEYFTAKTQDRCLQHQKALLEPLLQHSVIPTKQKEVMDALVACPHTFKLLRTRLPLLERLYHDDTLETSVFKSQILSLFKEIPGLYTLQRSDIVCYPDQVKKVYLLFSNSWQALLRQSKSLQESASIRLALYIQHDFSKNLSAFMTYPQTLIVQKLLNKDNNAALFVEHCFKQVVAGQELSLPFLLQELKGFFKLNTLTTLDEELDAIKTIKEPIEVLGSQHVLPLLASFIKTDRGKQDFLNAQNNPSIIRCFIIQNAAQIQALQAKSGKEILTQALILINQLAPVGKAYFLNDLHNPLDYGQQMASQVERDIQQKIAVAFLSGAEFQEALRQLFNEEDYKALLRVLSLDSNILALTERLFLAKGMAGLDKDAVFSILKSQHPSLAQIKPLNERIKDFQEAYKNIENDLESHLDKAKVANLMAHSLAPVLFHKQFLQTINKMMGFLGEQDLFVLFQALGKEDPLSAARESVRFMAIIKNKDKSALAKEFLLCDKKDDGSEMTLPFHHVLSNIREVGEEILRCHCYYNQQNKTGNIAQIKPALYSRLSSSLADIRVRVDDYSFFNRYSRKLFYVQGLFKGLSVAGKINAEANQHKADILERVKTHILRPLWWTSNVSIAMHDFIKGCRDITHSCVDAWYYFINTFKGLLNWLTRSSYFILSEKNKDSVDFNDTTFDFTQIMNNLTPFDGEKAKQDKCPTDAITQVEDYVVKHPPRTGFFVANLGRISEVLEDEVKKNVPCL